MIACTTALVILTILLFTLSNPMSSGGPDTERVLSGQAASIGMLMAVAYVIPLVLSCAYPVYGERCCQALKDEEVPESEEKVGETGKVDWVVLVIAILHWGVVLLVIVLFLFARFAGGSTEYYDTWDHVIEDNTTKCDTNFSFDGPYVGQFLPGCVNGDGCHKYESQAAAEAACIAAGSACGGVLTGGSAHGRCVPPQF